MCKLPLSDWKLAFSTGPGFCTWPYGLPLLPTTSNGHPAQKILWKFEYNNRERYEMTSVVNSEMKSVVDSSEIKSADKIYGSMEMKSVDSSEIKSAHKIYGSMEMKSVDSSGMKSAENSEDVRGGQF